MDSQNNNWKMWYIPMLGMHELWISSLQLFHHTVMPLCDETELSIDVEINSSVVSVYLQCCQVEIEI